MQFYADQAEKGKVAFKQYSPILLENQERAIADENASQKTTAKTANTSRTAQIPLPASPIYYYHPDHLGTSTFLTDANGNAYQFFLNLPFGETMAEQLGTSYYKNPYKFNGKELDEETGLYYYGARYYDPKNSIWMSVDPLAEDYHNVNPYNYCFSNPINLIDPTGMGPEGDYYGSNGKHLGSDGINDNKVYVADSVEKNKAGLVTCANNSTDLGITHSEFLFASQTLYAESSPKTSESEVAGIFSVLENRAQAYDTDVMSQMSPKYPMGVYGSREKDRTRYSESGPQAETKRSTVRAGLILGLTSNNDYSNGAFFWDGTDFKSGGGHNARYVPGYSFSDKSHDIYNLGNNIKSGSTKFGSWDFKYESTGVIGKTTFSKLSDTWRDAQYSGKRMTKPLGN